MVLIFLLTGVILLYAAARQDAKAFSEHPFFSDPYGCDIYQ